MRHRGFSLLELMVVVSIIIIIGLAAMPGLTSFTRERAIYSVGVQMQQDIRLIQQYSITQRTEYPTYGIDFTLDASSHVISYSVILDTKTRKRIIPSSVLVSLPLSGLTFHFGFDSFGRPLHDGTLPLTSDATILLSDPPGSKQLDLVVSSVLGRVSLSWLKR